MPDSYAYVSADDLTARYGDRLEDPLVSRQATDEIMWEIRQLSGQQYVDRYASRSAQVAAEASLAAVGSPSGSGAGALPSTVGVPSGTG